MGRMAVAHNDATVLNVVVTTTPFYTFGCPMGCSFAQAGWRTSFCKLSYAKILMIANAAMENSVLSESAVDNTACSSGSCT